MVIGMVMVLMAVVEVMVEGVVVAVMARVGMVMEVEV